MSEVLELVQAIEDAGKLEEFDALVSVAREQGWGDPDCLEGYTAVELEVYGDLVMPPGWRDTGRRYQGAAGRAEEDVMGKTSIEWTEYSWNPIRHKDGGHGCVKVSPGCANCYAERMQPRFGKRRAYNAKSTEGLYLDERVLREPLSWWKPRMVFVCSMTDLFGEWVKPEWIRDIFDVMGTVKAHTFQVLTKRPERIEPMLYGEQSNWYLGGGDYYPNIWLGFSAEDQRRYDERVGPMLELAAAGWLAWASLEPLLGPIDISEGLPLSRCAGCGNYLDGLVSEHCIEDLDRQGNPIAGYPCGPVNLLKPGLRWIVAGGESGPKARPCHPDWARSIRDQCLAAGVPFHWKQWGEWAPAGSAAGGVWSPPKGRNVVVPAETEIVWSDGSTGSGHGTGCDMLRVGKKAAGRLLDGRTWDEFPRWELEGLAR